MDTEERRRWADQVNELEAEVEILTENNGTLAEIIQDLQDQLQKADTIPVPPPDCEDCPALLARCAALKADNDELGLVIQGMDRVGRIMGELVCDLQESEKAADAEIEKLRGQVAGHEEGIENLEQFLGKIISQLREEGQTKDLAGRAAVALIRELDAEIARLAVSP
jgi:hypothetical protein